MLNIGGLNQGVVIDHIEAGDAMRIYEYLQLEKTDAQVAIIKNAKSNKMGRKDIIKIEGPITWDLDVLAVMNPKITINVIEKAEIVEKRHLKYPERVCGILKCKNPRCISSIEQELEQEFKLTDPERGVYRCVYCEQAYKRN